MKTADWCYTRFPSACSRKLRTQATAAQVQFFVVTQYYDDEIINSNSEMPKLTDCLRNSPVKIIDTFSAIKSREKDIHALYFGSFTHMTGAGNKVIADTIAARLSGERPLHIANHCLEAPGVHRI
jgi:hypothetical protein